MTTLVRGPPLLLSVSGAALSQLVDDVLVYVSVPLPEFQTLYALGVASCPCVTDTANPVGATLSCAWPAAGLTGNVTSTFCGELVACAEKTVTVAAYVPADRFDAAPNTVTVIGMPVTLLPLYGEAVSQGALLERPNDMLAGLKFCTLKVLVACCVAPEARLGSVRLFVLNVMLGAGAVKPVYVISRTFITPYTVPARGQGVIWKRSTPLVSAAAETVIVLLTFQAVTNFCV